MQGSDRPVSVLIALFQLVRERGATSSEIRALFLALEQAKKRVAALEDVLNKSIALIEPLAYINASHVVSAGDQRLGNTVTLLISLHDALLAELSLQPNRTVQPDIRSIDISPTKPSQPAMPAPPKAVKSTAGNRAQIETLLSNEKVKTLRAVWSRTVAYQAERSFPSKKSDAVIDLASYYLEWQQGDLELVKEDIEWAKEWGPDKTSLKEIRRHNDEE